MNSRGGVALAALAAFTLVLSACGSDAPTSQAGSRPRIVVTYAVLGAVVREVVGDRGEVIVLMPNGANPHEWSPSAKDVESMLNADLVIDNGLGLEGNLQDPLKEAEAKGVRLFTVADHITVRQVKTGEGVDPGDADQSPGVDDPHLWMDPLTMKQWIGPLVTVLGEIGIDAVASGSGTERELDALNAEVEATLAGIPAGARKLVTGHESMGYFADRYGFQLIGAIVPGITSQAESSAGVLAELIDEIRAAGVPAVFTEIGTPAATAEAISSDSGAKVVELSTHNLPEDGTYRSFMLNIATTVAQALS